MVLIADKTAPRQRSANDITLSDASLRRRVLAGDASAFETIVRRYNQRLYRFARSMLGDDQDARDVLQDAYVRAYLALDSFKGPDGFASWLHVIVRNQALELLRRQQREIATEAGTVERLMNDSGSTEQADPQRMLEGERVAKALEAALDRLPDAFRMVFVLRVVDGMSVRETSQVLDLNEKTVKTRLFRAKRMLREQFRGYLRSAGEHVYEFAGRRCDALTAAVMAALRCMPPTRSASTPSRPNPRRTWPIESAQGEPGVLAQSCGTCYGRCMEIRIKRVYEAADEGDGQCFFVERLWPRGISKASLSFATWLKDVAPSSELRQWFGHRPERWDAFRRRYRAELEANPEAWAPLSQAAGRGTVTLLYSARDEEHNAARVLRDFLLDNP